MKRIAAVIIVTLAALVLHACKGSGKNDKVTTDTFLNDVKDTMPATTTATASGTLADKEHDVHPVTLTPVVSSKDVRFASVAANDGINEVNNGKMAQQKTTNERVRNFAAMLVNDHTKVGDELATIARDKKITLPALPGIAEMRQANRLAMKQGNDFDKAYVDAMIDDEKKTIALFENASTNCVDQTLKAFASKTVPVLKMHLDSAQAIRASIQ
jgi:putative membrane protein